MGRVCVGQILGPHGVRGLVKLASFTAEPDAIADYAPLTDEPGRQQFEIELLAAQKGHFLARIVGVESRDAAEKVAGTRLFTDRDRLPLLADEEFYHADLIGLRAERTDGALFGKVVALHNFGAGDVIEIETEKGRIMLPFSRATVPIIAVPEGRIVVEPPAEQADGPKHLGSGGEQ